MAPMKRKYRTIYIVTAALMVAMIGGYALAATSLTPGPTQTSNVTTSPTAAFAQGTITSEQLVVLTTAMSSVTVAGNQTGTVALYGTTYRLAICTVAPCAAQNYRPVLPAAPVVGDYGEQIVLSVTQPLTGGPTAPSGFDFSITVSITVGVTTTPVVFQGYLATGSSATGSMTIPVFLFADLGTTTAPVINSISAVFNTCSSTTNCP